MQMIDQSICELPTHLTSDEQEYEYMYEPIEVNV